MLPIQAAELNERLRRSVRIVGEGLVGIEQPVSPVMLLQDATRTPYRTEPLSWTGYDLMPAVAAQNGFVAWYLTDTDIALALIQGVHVQYDLAAAAAQTINMSVARVADLPAGVEAQVSLTEPVTYDGTVIRRALPRTRTWNSAAFVPNAVSIGTATIPTGSFNPANPGWSEVALPVLLQPGHAIVFNTGNNNLAARVWGRGISWRHNYQAPA